MRNTLRSHRALRKEARLPDHTQFDVSRAIGMHRDRYCRIENGYAEPSDDEREKLAAFFGVKVSVLFPGATRRKAVKPSGATA